MESKKQKKPNRRQSKGLIRNLIMWILYHDLKGFRSEYLPE
nr:MAG TPA: hypothetical protein [Caudoviricetes sp.]